MKGMETVVKVLIGESIKDDWTHVYIPMTTKAENDLK